MDAESELTKSQLDRLGDRLRTGATSEADLRMLDRYRRSFGKSYELVVRDLRKQLSLEPTGRPAKSTRSVIDKLHRESMRLTQMQDIAGCRVIVDHPEDQDQVVNSMRALFNDMVVVDRREQPSHGYRAVHVLARVEGNVVEIQVRTTPQHLWAELSEKLADVIPDIKYGGGDKTVRRG